jgi:uncharacterized protein YegL
VYEEFVMYRGRPPVIEEPANYINHIGLVLDGSASMRHLELEVVKVADSQIAHLAQRSKELDQETRITVYVFNSYQGVKCIFYDKDVLRMPSLASRYSCDGQTPLIDATLKAIEDLKRTPELYGDHAFLMYVLTDGQENDSSRRPYDLQATLSQVADNWTVAVMVPNQDGVFEAKKFGFPPNNIAVWDATTVKGVVEAGERIRQTTDTFMQARTQGVRGSKNIFQMDVSGLTPTVVASTLQKLDANRYDIVDVDPNKGGWQIKDFVETVAGQTYYTGMAYYQITKPETIQPTKKVLVRDRASGRVYAGTSARSLIGIPDYEIKVRPADHPKYEVFIQSTSVNRKLVGGTKLLIMR